MTEEIISYNYLNVIKEGEAVDIFQEIDERLNEINNKKKVVKSSFDFDTHPINVKLPETNQPNTEKWHQHALFNDEIDYKSNKPDISIDANVVKSITLQLITGSIVISDTSRIDPEKWANQMVKVFDKRFNGNIHLFSEWIEMFADFIINNFIPGEHRKIDIDDYVSELCKAVYKTLGKLPSNTYIDTIKDTITLWIME